MKDKIAWAKQMPTQDRKIKLLSRHKKQHLFRSGDSEDIARTSGRNMDAIAVVTDKTELLEGLQAALKSTSSQLVSLLGKRSSIDELTFYTTETYSIIQQVWGLMGKTKNNVEQLREVRDQKMGVYGSAMINRATNAKGVEYRSPIYARDGLQQSIEKEGGTVHEIMEVGPGRILEPVRFELQYKVGELIESYDAVEREEVLVDITDIIGKIIACSARVLAMKIQEKNLVQPTEEIFAYLASKEDVERGAYSHDVA